MFPLCPFFFFLFPQTTTTNLTRTLTLILMPLSQPKLLIDSSHRSLRTGPTRRILIRAKPLRPLRIIRSPLLLLPIKPMLTFEHLCKQALFNHLSSNSQTLNTFLLIHNSSSNNNNNNRFMMTHPHLPHRRLRMEGTLLDRRAQPSMS